MKVKLKAIMAGPDGSYQPGNIIDVSKEEGQALIEGDYAEEFISAEDAAAKAAADKEAKDAAAKAAADKEAKDAAAKAAADKAAKASAKTSG